MKLTQLQRGVKAQIVCVNGSGAGSIRLLEMGLIPGRTVERLRTAPLGDPTEYYVEGCRLALRHREASCIRIALVPCDADTPMAKDAQVAEPALV